MVFNNEGECNMFIINLTYKKSTDEVDNILPQHILYLEKNYAQKNFICSGRKNPRNGGIIICRLKSIEEVKQIIQEDPFYKNGIATYDIINFCPSKYADGFEKFID